MLFMLNLLSYIHQYIYSITKLALRIKKNLCIGYDLLEKKNPESIPGAWQKDNKPFFFPNENI